MTGLSGEIRQGGFNTMVNRMRAHLLLVMLLAVGSALAQAPTGTIAGVVADPTGTPIAGSRLRVTNRDSGLTRTLTTSADGDYSAAALPPGVYQVRAEADGFGGLERAAIVETGVTTTLNMTLQVNELSEQVTVDTAAPLIQYEHHQVGGLISRKQIEDLPLNGRNFLELAKLEPGVQAPARASSNRTFVPALGQPGGNSGRGTRETVDGGSIMAVGNGGSAMGFSQEVVNEFQIATVSFDLTTGLTNGAAINVTTRSGGNGLHGTGFYFFRGHNLAAYPGLSRNIADPNPFFQRQQFGFALGGPIRRDRFFFFGMYERNSQRGVAATTLLVPEFAHLNRITPSPYFGTQLSMRLDGRLTKTHTAFARYSHDGIRAFGPTTLQPNSYPSSWTSQPAWADQSILGLTSVYGDTLVNDLRFSFFYVSSSQVPVTQNECPDCLGIGAPSISVLQTGLILGGSFNQKTLGRRFHLNDYVTWQRAAHRLRFGVDWEYNRGGTVSASNEPATFTLFSPQRARQAGIPLPSEFRTLDDILELPLQSVTVGVGDPRVPQANGSLVRSWHTLRLFFQDTWRLRRQLTVNYGLGWSIDRNLNYDLSKPTLLAPILGADNLGPTRRQWKNFSPVLGLAWSPGHDGKTVIRAGSGLFYDFLFPPYLDNERALLSPPVSGRQNISGNRLFNCLPGIAGVPVGAPLNFPNTPTRFRGAHLLTCLPAIRSDLEQSLANAERSVQAIQLTKQAAGLSPVDVPSWSALHVNVGVQREIARSFVLSADFAFRHFDHIGLGQLDLNHFNSARGPVIPRCIDEAQRNDPHALCSTGPINVQTNAGRVSYKGLLVRADKRFSRGFQLIGSWAYSSNTGTSTAGGDGRQPPGFNLDDWLSNRGPLANDITHIVNLAGVVQLPTHFRLGFNFSYASAPPLSAFIAGSDFNGDGTTDDLLPGTTVNAFNRGFGRTELESLVGQFNQIYAGRVDAKGAVIPHLVLPERYWFGDNFHSLDLRLTREFQLYDRWRLALIGEVFNVFNAANLSGHSGNLTNIAFGQPSARFTQVFGSGGPRAFQLGARISF
jgi:hypothetical protein